MLSLANAGHGGVPLRFYTDRPGYVSLNLYRPDGSVARQLVTAEWFPVGDHEVEWDGRPSASESRPDDVLPPGEYPWRAIFHEGLGLRLRGWACNDGPVPWETADGRGGSGGDRGVPSAVAAEGERVFLGWTLAEAGQAVLACDLGGRVLWGQREGAVGGCKALGVDDGVVYVLGGAAGVDAEGGAIYRLRADDGAKVPWPNGAQDLKIESLWPAAGISKPLRADAMAVRDGRIYLSFTKDEFMAVLESKTGAYLETVVGAPPGAVDAVATKTDLPGKPGVLVPADFAVTALHGGVLGKLLLNHDPLWIVASDLTPLEREERITALTLIGDGAKFHRHDVFIGLGEPFHQVQARPILQPEGFTWSAGRSGGRALLGPWQPDGLRNIKGVALDSAGQLWVAEGDGFPKRFSVWTTDGSEGKLVREFLGPADLGARGGAIHPDDPNLMAGQGCEWRLNPKTGRAACLGIITREGMDSARFCKSPGGKIFLVVAHTEKGSVSIFERIADGDYRPRARIFTADANGSEIPAGAAGENGARMHTVLWADENGDGEQQPGEMHTSPAAWQFGGSSLPATPDLTLCGTNPLRPRRGFAFKVTGWTACGAPIYDISHPAALPAYGERSPDGRLLLQWESGDGKLVPKFTCWDLASLRAKWTYPADGAASIGSASPPGEVPGARGRSSALPAALAALQPGEIRGARGVCGCVHLASPLGDVWVIPTQTGAWHLLTEDGFYLARLFEPDPAKARWPATAAPGADFSQVSAGAGYESFGGSVTQGADGKVYLQAGQTAFWNLEVTGLDTVRALPGGTAVLVAGEGKLKSEK